MSLDVHGNLTMKALLEEYPGARRALFAAFHIGGCQACAYAPEDSLATVCDNIEIPLDEAIKCLRESHAHDQEMLIQPTELQKLFDEGELFVLLDTRTREEFEAITLPKARLMTQELQTEIFADSNQEQKIVLLDHQGRHVLDHCAWFRGHGLKNTFGVDGGIDRFAKDVDPSIPRYRLEIDDPS